MFDPRIGVRGTTTPGGYIPPDHSGYGYPPAHDFGPPFVAFDDEDPDPAIIGLLLIALAIAGFAAFLL